MVVITLYLTAKQLNVILTGINRVAVMDGMGIVVTLQNIVLVGPVLTTELYTKTGENQEENRGGGTTKSVVVTTPYLTVQLPSVILTVINRVVVVVWMENVVTQRNFVLVVTVPTTELYTKTGENQKENRGGDMTDF